MVGWEDDCAIDGLEHGWSESRQNPPHGTMTKEERSGSRALKQCRRLVQVSSAVWRAKWGASPARLRICITSMVKGQAVKGRVRPVYRDFCGAEWC